MVLLMQINKSTWELQSQRQSRVSVRVSKKARHLSRDQYTQSRRRFALLLEPFSVNFLWLQAAAQEEAALRSSQIGRAPMGRIPKPFSCSKPEAFPSCLRFRVKMSGSFRGPPHTIAPTLGAPPPCNSDYKGYW